MCVRVYVCTRVGVFVRVCVCVCLCVKFVYVCACCFLAKAALLVCPLCFSFLNKHKVEQGRGKDAIRETMQNSQLVIQEEKNKAS